MPVPTTRFFTGRMPFPPPNQQRQSTEGIKIGLHMYLGAYEEICTQNGNFCSCVVGLKIFWPTAVQNLNPVLSTVHIHMHMFAVHVDG